jgi:hypothetical protein
LNEIRWTELSGTQFVSIHDRLTSSRRTRHAYFPMSIVLSYADMKVFGRCDLLRWIVVSLGRHLTPLLGVG